VDDSTHWTPSFFVDGAAAPGVLHRVVLLVDVRLVPDEVLRPADRLGQVVAVDDRTEALVGLVPDPGARRGQLRERLTELVDRRLRLEDVPDEEANDRQNGPRGS
jgi:hypothetical protein